MATITKVILSGSSRGQAINVSATQGSATLLHSFTTSTAVLDEVWVYATNSSTNTISTIIVLNSASADGGSASGLMRFEVPPTGNGFETLIPGFIFLGQSSCASLYVYASTSNVISVFGHVNRIT